MSTMRMSSVESRHALRYGCVTDDPAPSSENAEAYVACASLGAKRQLTVQWPCRLPLRGLGTGEATTAPAKR